MKTLFNSVLFKEQLKRFWPISVLLSIVLLVTVIFPVYQSPFGISNLMTLISMRNPAVMVTAALAPMITAMALFSYGYQNRSTTAMYAYPLKREQILVTNALAGLTLYSLPMLVTCLLLLNPVTSPDVSKLITPPVINVTNGTIFFEAPVELYHRAFIAGDVVNTPLIVAGFFARIFICFTFYYTLFIFVSTLAGNGVVYLVMCVGLPFVPIGFIGLSQIAAQYYSYGYSININYHWILQFLVNFNPVLLFRNFHMYPANNPDIPFPTDPGATASLWRLNILPPLLWYIVLSAVFFIISVYCCRKRRAERAGDSVVFKPVKNILIFLMAY